MEYNIHGYSFGIFGKLIQPDYIKLDRDVETYSIRNTNFGKFITQNNTMQPQ